METPVNVEAPVKQKKSVGAIIGSIAAIVLCGLTGLCLLCPLSVLIFTGTAQNWTNTYFANWFGALPFCFSIVFIAIGVAVPIILLRKKNAAAKDILDDVNISQEPLPPAS